MPGDGKDCFLSSESAPERKQDAHVPERKHDAHLYLVLMASSARMNCEACKRETMWRYQRLTKGSNRFEVEHLWLCTGCGKGTMPFQPAFG